MGRRAVRRVIRSEAENAAGAIHLPRGCEIIGAPTGPAAAWGARPTSARSRPACGTRRPSGSAMTRGLCCCNRMRLPRQGGAPPAGGEERARPAAGAFYPLTGDGGVPPATAALCSLEGNGFCGPGHDGQTTFLFAKRKAFWISKEKRPIGIMRFTISAVRTGTVNASIERCRFSSACGTARIPIGRLLLRSLRHQPPGRWRNAIETA